METDHFIARPWAPAKDCRCRCLRRRTVGSRLLRKGV